jgi:Zn-dependent peptidase ImmA (M78 family)
MRRGFKAEAERIALEVRGQMGHKSTDPLDARALARHLGAQIKSADELTSLTKLQELEKLQAGAFSACTFTINDHHIIVYNPLATPARTQSDVCHEAGHLILHHNVKDIQTIGGVTFFACDPDEEQEANWLAGCLLLPRPLSVSCVKRRMDAAAISWTYNVSQEMATYRLRATGVLRQLTGH